MDKITLHVKVMSCKGLKAFNFFHKLSVYALVSVLIRSDGEDEEEGVQQLLQKLQHRTRRDEGGDGDPEWNHEMIFDVDEGLYRSHSDRLLIRFELLHEGIMFGDKVIGDVRVPLKDLIGDELSSDGVARFVSYEVRSTDGKPNGVLNFSYRLLNRIPKVQPLPRTSPSSTTNDVTGYPTSPGVQSPYLPSAVTPPQQVPLSWPTQYPYPPPPPVVHGAYYYPPPPPPPPPPPQVHCWPPPQQHVGPQYTWSSSGGESRGLGNQEMWPTPSGHHHQRWSPFWNGS